MSAAAEDAPKAEVICAGTPGIPRGAEEHVPDMKGVPGVHIEEGVYIEEGESMFSLEEIKTRASQRDSGIIPLSPARLCRWTTIPTEGADKELRKFMDSKKLPTEEIIGILEPGTCLISGSALLYAIICARGGTPGWEPNDLDIFVEGDPTCERARNLLVEKEGKQVDMPSATYDSQFGVWTYLMPSGFKVQIISLAGRPKHWISRFDLDLVKNYFDGHDVFMSYASQRALDEGVVGIPEKTSGSLHETIKVASRVEKFYLRGFGGPPSVMITDYGSRKQDIIDALKGMANKFSFHGLFSIKLVHPAGNKTQWFVEFTPSSGRRTKAARE